MERRKRTQVTNPSHIKDLEMAMSLFDRYQAYERGQGTLTEEEMTKYRGYKEAIRPLEEESARLIKAVRDSERLTWRDYAIVINAR